MRNSLIYFFIINILLVFNGGFGAPSKYEGMIIRKIEFTGIKNVTAGDLKIAIETTEVDIGFPLKAMEIAKAIKLLFNKGQFEDVSVEVDEYRDGVSLRFVCKERPEISKIEFKGAEEIGSVDLQALILIKEGDPLKLNVIESSIKKMKDKYKEDGFYNAVINYKLKKDEKKNTVELIFIIDEGEKIKIVKISILGAKKIKAGKLIGAMDSKEDSWTSDSKFNKDLYEQDKGKIVAYYKERGYLDAQIIEDKVEYQWVDPIKKEKRGIFITIKVTEGEKYYFDKYTIAGNKVFDAKYLESKFEQTETGAIFDYSKFQRDYQSMIFAYGSKGYIMARIAPDKIVEERPVKVGNKTEKRKFVRYDFKIEEGSQAYIERIIIKGNKKTKEKVIRREVLVKEGELFDSSKILITKEKIFNLGYFTKVDIEFRPGSREGYYNCIIDVEEQSTGTISLGGGYGTNSGFSIFVNVGESNIAGNGQKADLRVQYGPVSSSITLSFTEPWLFNYPVGFTSTVFYELSTIKVDSIFSNTNKNAEYQLQSIGYTLGLSYKFWIRWGIGNVWKHSFSKVLSASGNTSDDILIQQSYGLDESRTLTYYIYRDSKDNYMNPTKGSRIEFSTGFTGGTILGGSSHYITYSPEFFYYYSPFTLPFLKTHPVVFEFRGNGTFRTPPFDRKSLEDKQSPEDNPWLKKGDMLYLGGAETLRGWEPYDNSFPDSWQNRLYDRITYGAEMRIPIAPQFFWFVFFFDAGSLWTDSYWEKSRIEEEQKVIERDKANNQLYDIRDIFSVDNMSYFKYSYGVGFKLQIPMMPLRFWFGKKLEWVGMHEGCFKQMGGINFQFSIGDFRF